MRNRDPNSVSGVKMPVAGGSTASVVFSAAFRTGSGASAPARRVYPASVPSSRVVRLVEATGRRSRARWRAGAAGRRDRSPRRTARRSAGHQHFAFAGGDHVGERRQRLRVDERDRAADDDQRMARRALGGVGGHAGQAQQREHVHVVPLEGHGERDDVELADRRLRFERQQRRLGGRQLRQLLLRRQEEPLADDVRLRR